MQLKENEQKRKTIEEIHELRELQKQYLHELRELQKQYLKDWATNPESRRKAEEIDKKILLLSKTVEY